MATGKRKRPSAAEADDTLKGKALADDPPAASSSAAETARKRVREVEMEEARDDETEPGEITTKGKPSPSSTLLPPSQLSLVVDESWLVVGGASWCHHIRGDHGRQRMSGELPNDAAALGRCDSLDTNPPTTGSL